VLTFQPWKFSDKLIEDHCKGNENGSNNWHISELTHACLIMVFFHKLSSIVESIKIENPLSPVEVNLNKGKRASFEYMENVEKEKIKKIIVNLQILTRENTSQESQSFKNDSDTDESLKNLTSTREVRTPEIFAKHVSDYITGYTDFDPFSGDSLSNLEFNWDDQGYDILMKYYGDGTDCLNEEMNYVFNLTSNSIGQEAANINTFLIRKSLTCYLEMIHGYVNKGFDYSKINKLMSINQKIFIKNVCCYPHKISEKLFSWMTVVFTKEEILHIILLASTVKMRLQMTFIAKALHELSKKVE